MAAPLRPPRDDVPAKVALGKRPSVVRARKPTLVVALALTAVLTWAALVVDHNSNTRLLQLQVTETAVALSLSQVPTELADALQVAAATYSAAAFDRFNASTIGAGQLAGFSLWRRDGTALQLVAHVGSTSGVTDDTQVMRFLSRVHPDASAVGPDESEAPSPVRVGLPKDATILAFTDGLVERRGEHLDIGVDRLRVAFAHQSGSVKEVVDGLVSDVLPESFEDDVAIVGVRWRD